MRTNAGEWRLTIPEVLLIVLLLAMVGAWGAFVSWQAEKSPARTGDGGTVVTSGDANDQEQMELARRIIVYGPRGEAPDAEEGEAELARRIIVYGPRGEAVTEEDAGAELARRIIVYGPNSEAVAA